MKTIPFAARLRALREAAGLSIADLSARTGIARATLTRYEQGKREPLLAQARRLALPLGVDLNAFA